MQDDSHQNTDTPLLGPDDPPPFELLNPEGTARVVLTCDHASSVIPASLKNLGLDSLARGRHIACDIGAGDVTRWLSRYLDAPTVVCGYSRLVVDCNRPLGDATSIRAVSDGEFITGNHNLSAADHKARVDNIFWPYHNAISATVDRFKAQGVTPAFISIHSFTPFFDNINRPWEIGILWDTDARIPVPLMDKLRSLGVCVGDNEPYSGRLPLDFTIDYHAELPGLPHVSIEIRQDLVSTPDGFEKWAAIVGKVLKEILSEDDLYRVLPGTGAKTQDSQQQGV